MALIQADRVKESSSTTGTGNFALGGAVTGFRTFADGVGVSNTCYYVITDDSSYEVGLGTLNASATLARTTVITSSNSNSAVDWGAGSKNVFTTYPGPKAVVLDSNNELILASALGVAGNVSVGGTFQVTGEFNLTDISASGTLDVAGNGSVGGTFNVEGDLKNTSGNLTVDPATQIFEIKGSGSTEGQIQLNCAVNTHGQIITAADHGVSATNTLTLPGGDTIGNANATLVSDTGTQTISNKTFDDVTLGTGTADISTMVSQVAFQNNLRERTSINTTSATGTINFDILSHNVELRTNDAAANFELNFRGNASTAFSATVAVGQTTSFAFESSMGSTAYYLTAIQIDGSTASPVHWQGGTTAPSEGNAAGIDSYLINITRGADGGSGTAQYTCLASQTQFGKVTY
jgi:cytoskeletal protein CcmA (bactofilin family)